MPSTPSLFDFSGLTTPRRPAQVASGRRRDSGWRSRGTQFYCVSTIAFDHALVDFETLSIVFLGQRYLLGLSPFLIFVRLLLAEGEPVSYADLGAALGWTPQASGTTIKVARHVRHLYVALAARGQGALLVRQKGLGALRMADPASRRRTLPR